MEEKKKVFEVRSDFYDDELGAWAIDCWFDADDNSEGECVAYVDDNGNVKWNNELYKGDKMVEEEIATLIKEEGLKPVVEKKLGELTVGDRVYILSESSYCIGRITSIVEIGDDGKEVKIASDEDNILVQLFTDDMDTTLLYWFVSDETCGISGDIAVTTSKQDAIEHFEQVKESVERIINKFKD